MDVATQLTKYDSLGGVQQNKYWYKNNKHVKDSRILKKAIHKRFNQQWSHLKISRCLHQSQQILDGTQQ